MAAQGKTKGICGLEQCALNFGRGIRRGEAKHLLEFVGGGGAVTLVIIVALHPGGGELRLAVAEGIGPYLYFAAVVGVGVVVFGVVAVPSDEAQVHKICRQFKAVRHGNVIGEGQGNVVVTEQLGHVRADQRAVPELDGEADRRVAQIMQVGSKARRLSSSCRVNRAAFAGEWGRALRPASPSRAQTQLMVPRCRAGACRG